MAPVLRSLLMATGVTTVAVAFGVAVLDQPSSSSGTHPPTVPVSATPSPTRTALASLDTEALVVRRQSFCADLPDAAIATALGDPVSASSVYGSGDEITVPGGQDVGDEDGCRWDTRDGAHAAAWVFVPPVTVASAQALVGSIGASPGCTRPAAPAYGAPTLALVCSVKGVRVASFRGLFGDAWLTCTLSPATPDPDLLAHTAQWCTAVALAASATPGG